MQIVYHYLHYLSLSNNFLICLVIGSSATSELILMRPRGEPIDFVPFLGPFFLFTTSREPPLKFYFFIYIMGHIIKIYQILQF